MGRLDQFFGGYFHQDWSEDDSSWQAVVWRYRADGMGAEAGLVAEEIVQLINRNPDDDSLAAKLNQLGCFYWPGAKDLYRAWLFEVADALR
ncbi:contact-dependent growth inhibition system immunity protein [Dyella soli]|uniref:CdiI immunity protein domain-containing protein n=1 Tax=Dyella soli TaxID=522319 RepID=A0A4R0YLY2_9GAMM|nr:contact-dependent growth inhibition system immunity protein [Dyella soli]TCI07325.1 hypothetical protein EZM97_32570 [Dyella soli]